MTETYPIPNQLQLPNIPQSSYAIQDDGALATAQAANFIRQWNEVTNIANADRAQSLREKQFQQLVVQNDRDYDLRREKQDQDMRIGDLSFELRKFQYDTEKKNFAQLEETWAKKDEIIGALEAFSPNGGNDQQYPQARVRVFKMFANNPNSYKIVQGILGPYDEQYQVFKANKYSEDAVEVQGAFDDGLLDGINVGETRAVDYWRNAKLNQNDDPDGFAAAVRQLRRKINEIRTTEAEGKFAAQSVAEGNIVTREMKLPDGTTLKSTAPRVYGTSRTGTSASAGVKTYEKADFEVLDAQIKSAENTIAELDSKIADEDNELKKAGLQAERDGLVAKKDSLQKVVDMGVKLLEQKATTQLPQTTGQPQATPAGGAKKRTLQPPSFPAPATPPRPQPSANPMSSTTTPTTTETAVIGYVSEEGMRLTEAEAKAQRAAGRQVFPIRPPAVANPFGAPVVSEGVKASISG
jgi:hypothetical protein